MDRDLVHRALRKLALMLHVSTSLLKPTRVRPLEGPQTRHQEAVMIDKAAKRFDGELSTYIATHAKAECMTLAMLFQSKLPRELRDMVYAHLLPRDTYIVGRPDRNVRWLRSLRQNGCDHLFVQGYVPLDTMKEVSEMWYKVSTFIVLGFPSERGRNPKRASDALDFFLHDMWGLDIDVRQHVKHIHIRLEYIGNVGDNVTQLDAYLRRLLPLGVNARVVVNLECPYRPFATLRGQQVIALVTELQLIFPVLEELIKGGKRVMINVKGYNVFEVKVEKLIAPIWISQLSKVLSVQGLLALQR